MWREMLSHDTEYKFEIDQVFSSSRNFVMTFALKEDYKKFSVQWWNFKIAKVHEFALISLTNVIIDHKQKDWHIFLIQSHS